MYADKITESMRACIEETARRRAIQADFNRVHGIVPRSTTAEIHSIERDEPEASSDGAAARRGRGKATGRTQRERTSTSRRAAAREAIVGITEVADAELLPQEIATRLSELRRAMQSAAAAQRYEDAATLRDRVRVLEARALEFVR